MAYDNAQMAQAWGDLLGLTSEQVTTLQQALDQWALGGARLATWSRLATDVSTFNDAAARMVHDWYGGTAVGGPNGDGLYPLMNSEAVVFCLPSPARIVADLAGFNPLGTLPSVGHLPAIGEPGDLWIIDGNAWAWSALDGEWKNLGPFRGATGLSAKDIIISAGHLPANATDDDFADWLADSQVGRVQPYLTAAENARDAAQQALRDTEDLAVQVLQDTGADRQAVADDKVAVIAEREAAEAAATTAATKAGEAVGSADDADTARIGSEAAATRAEQARDEAEAIAGGDFVTGPVSATVGRLAAFGSTNGRSIVEGPEIGVGAAGSLLRRSDGDSRYRDKEPVPLADVDGLADALGGKQASLGFTPADAADTYTKGEVDGVLEDKADLVDGKVPPAQLATATAAQVRAGKATGVVIEPDEAAGAMALVALTDAATVAVDLDTGPNFTLLTTAGVGVGRTIGLPINGSPGQFYTLTVTSDAAGRTLAWHTAFKWSKGSVKPITSTAGGKDKFSFQMIDATRFEVVGIAEDIR